MLIILDDSSIIAIDYVKPVCMMWSGRMKCAVIVMATLMIIASMLLVGVSLAMAEHIDELGNS